MALGRDACEELNFNPTSGCPILINSYGLHISDAAQYGVE